MMYGTKHCHSDSSLKLLVLKLPMMRTSMCQGLSLALNAHLKGRITRSSVAAALRDFCTVMHNGVIMPNIPLVLAG
jgi:hypothetical protein